MLIKLRNLCAKLIYSGFVKTTKLIILYQIFQSAQFLLLFLRNGLTANFRPY